MDEIKRSRFVYHKQRTVAITAHFNWIGHCSLISQKDTLIHKYSPLHSPILSLESLCNCEFFFPFRITRSLIKMSMILQCRRVIDISDVRGCLVSYCPSSWQSHALLLRSDILEYCSTDTSVMNCL